MMYINLLILSPSPFLPFSPLFTHPDIHTTSVSTIAPPTPLQSPPLATSIRPSPTLHPACLLRGPATAETMPVRPPWIPTPLNYLPGQRTMACIVCWPTLPTTLWLEWITLVPLFVSATVCITKTPVNKILLFINVPFYHTSFLWFHYKLW